MDVEAKWLRGIAHTRADLRICGVGPQRITDLLRTLPAGTPAVLLAGVAGGLRDTPITPRIRAVVDIHGRTHAPHWTTPWLPGSQECTLLGSNTVACTPTDKRSLRDRTGADLVDCETHALAAWAEESGVAWGVLRGVSDGPDAHLPNEVVGWLDETGRARTRTAIAGILRKPALIPTLLHLMRGTNLAMRALGHPFSRLLTMLASCDPGDLRHPAPRIGPFPIDESARRILVFGGTFDPPHRAHVELSLHAMRTLSCDTLLVVPAARSPHKATGPTTPDEDRVAMLELAYRTHPGVAICTAELDRATSGEPSYTIDTIRALRTRAPHAEFRLLIGADQAAAFHKWREPAALLELAPPAVVLRPPIDTTDALRAALAPHWSAEEVDRWITRIVPGPTLQISATSIRAGQASPDDLPAPVRRFLEQSFRLYRDGVPLK